MSVDLRFDRDSKRGTGGSQLHKICGFPFLLDFIYPSHRPYQSRKDFKLISLSQYSKVAHYNTTHLRRQSFYALPRAHWELLAAPPFSYLDTLNQIDDAIDQNSLLSRSILESGLQAFGITASKSPAQEVSSEWIGTAKPHDFEKARSTIKQFYRDWSEEGASEREACYGPVIRAVQAEAAKRPASSSTMRVLVPGAGLGRLVFDLCLAGFNTEGNEISYHSLLASSYILNHCPGPRVHALYPWIHSFSNHRNRTNQMKHVMIPDTHPGTLLSVEGAGQMSMSASDFLLLYGDEHHKGTFDIVATVFFLDTAPNIIRYLETIKNCLVKGGLLVNLGPLLWHFENDAPGKHGKGESSQTDDDGT